MAWKEKEIEKLYFSIGEVAADLNERTCTIRFWEGVFGLYTHRDRKNERKFLLEEFATMREIHRLIRIEGFTLSGARRKLFARTEAQVEAGIEDLKAHLVKLQQGLEAAVAPV